MTDLSKVSPAGGSQPPVSEPGNQSAALLIGSAVVVLAMIAAAAYVLLGGGDSGEEPSVAAAAPTTATERRPVADREQITLSGKAGERTVKLTMPKELKTSQLYGIEVEGQTGRFPKFTGGIIVGVFQISAKQGKCPKQYPEDEGPGPDAVDGILSTNVFAEGPYRSAARPGAPSDPGSYSICAYATSPEGIGRGGSDLAIEHRVVVAEAASTRTFAPTEGFVAPGVYAAEADDIEGGTPESRLELEVVRKGDRHEMAYVATANLPLPMCEVDALTGAVPEFTEEQLAGGVVSGGELVDVYDSFSSSWGTSQGTTVDGGAATDDEVRGQFVRTFPGQCFSAFAFTAKRVPGNERELREDLQ